MPDSKHLNLVLLLIVRLTLEIETTDPGKLEELWPASIIVECLLGLEPLLYISDGTQG